jgi:hypothetical protein
MHALTKGTRLDGNFPRAKGWLVTFGLESMPLYSMSTDAKHHRATSSGYLLKTLFGILTFEILKH